MAVQIIDDGFTVEDSLDACDAHDALNFSYRPATEEEFSRFSRKTEELARKPALPAAKTDLVGLETARFLSEHVKSWDVQNSQGEVVDVTSDHCLALPAAISIKLLEVIVTSSKSGEIREQLGN